MDACYGNCLPQSKKLFKLYLLLCLIIGRSFCQHAVCTQAIMVTVRQIIPLSIIQLYSITLAFTDITCPAFKQLIATRAGFGFMLAHKERAKVKAAGCKAGF